MASECLGNAEYLESVHGCCVPPRTSPGGLFTVQSLCYSDCGNNSMGDMIPYCSDYGVELNFLGFISRSIV